MLGNGGAWPAGSIASATTATCSFSNLRDRFGITQCVVEQGSSLFAAAEAVKLESVLSVAGEVSARSPETVNAKLATGEVELRLDALEVLSPAAPLPLQVNSEEPAGEEVRLRHRYLDLRRPVMQRRILLRNEIIASIRRRMTEQGFSEFQTPILTAASPRGCARLSGALAPPPRQVLRPAAGPRRSSSSLLMVSGFDRYFQIAPCFRDEDARADRSPGEFYQLDFEMSFATQEDVFAALEPVLHGVFTEFAPRSVRLGRNYGPALSAHPLRRGHAAFRHGQAGSAQPS